MGLLKVLGGAALGVLAVAALPIAGPIGVVTLGGAAVAGTVGGIGGAIASSMEEDEKNERYYDGLEQGRAESADKIDELNEMIKQAAARFEGYKEYENYVIALFAVGISVAACDGELLESEKQDLLEFVTGEAGLYIPQEIKSILKQIENNPPDFNTAMKYVEKVNKRDWDVFGCVIELAMSLDNYIHDKEKAYLEAWNRYRSA